MCFSRNASELTLEEFNSNIPGARSQSSGHSSHISSFHETPEITVHDINLDTVDASSEVVLDDAYLDALTSKEDRVGGSPYLWNTQECLSKWTQELKLRPY